MDKPIEQPQTFDQLLIDIGDYAYDTLLVMKLKKIWMMQQSPSLSIQTWLGGRPVQNLVLFMLNFLPSRKRQLQFDPTISNSQLDQNVNGWFTGFSTKIQDKNNLGLYSPGTYLWRFASQPGGLCIAVKTNKGVDWHVFTYENQYLHGIYKSYDSFEQVLDETNMATKYLLDGLELSPYKGPYEADITSA